MYFAQLDGMIPRADSPRQAASDFNIEYRRIGDSFRYHMKWTGEGDRSGRVDFDETSGYDAAKGVQRGFGADARLRSMDAYHGRISPVQTDKAFALHERYGRFFDGAYQANDMFYLPYLLKHRQEMHFERSSKGGEVEVVLDSNLGQAGGATGKVHMRFDLARGFLLTHVEDDHKTKSLYYKHVADVSKARLLQGVWIPEKILEVTAASVHKPGTGEVYEVELLDAALDSLTAKDLEVEFPPNTVYIYDSTTGKESMIDRQNNEVPFVLGSGGGSVSQPTNTQRRRLWVAVGSMVGIGFALVLGILVVRQWRRHVAGKSS